MAQEFWKNDPVVQPTRSAPAPRVQAPQGYRLEPVTGVDPKKVVEGAYAEPLAQASLEQAQTAIAKGQRDLATPTPIPGQEGWFFDANGNPVKINFPKTGDDAVKDAIKGFGLDQLLYSVERARGNLNSGWATGVGGAVGGLIPGSQRNNFLGNLESIKGKVVLDALQTLKEASKTGASGMGALSEKEGDRLAAAVSSLSENMSAEELHRSLTVIERQARILQAIAAGRNPEDPEVQKQFSIPALPELPKQPVRSPSGGSSGGWNLYNPEDLPPPPAPIARIDNWEATTDLTGAPNANPLWAPPGEVFLRWQVNPNDPRYGEAAGKAVPVFGPPEQRAKAGGLTQTLDAGVRGATNVLTVGFDQEIAALVDTVFKGGTYNRNLIEQQAVDAYDNENNFGARLTGQIAGSFALPTGLKTVVERKAAEVLARGGTQAEAVAAARSAVLPQLAKEGGAYGAAYGAGEGGSGIAERATGAAVGAATGAGAGAAAGRFGSGLLVPGNAGQATARASAASDQVAAAQAANDLGIDVPKFVVAGPGAANAANALERTQFGAGPIAGATNTMLDQSQAAARRIADASGTVLDPTTMGEKAVAAGNKALSAERRRVGNIFKAAEAARGDAVIPATETAATLAELASKQDEAIGGTAIGGIFRNLLDDLNAKGGVLTVDGARLTRSTLRKRLSEEVGTSDADRLTTQVMEAIGRDIEAGLTAAGKDKALQLYRQGNREWAVALRNEDKILRPYIGRDGAASGEEAARRIMADVKTNGTRIARFLKSLPEDEAGNIRATIINNLGRATSAGQDAAGEAFSLETFLTNWDKIRGARNLIFPKESVEALDKLAKVAAAARAAGRSKPPSGVAIDGASLLAPGGLGLAGVFTSVGDGDPKWAVLGMIGAGLAAGKQNASARLLANPAFAKRLAATPMAPKAAHAYWSRPWVASLAKSNPSIGAEIIGFQQGITRMLGGGLERSAAATKDEQDKADNR